MSVYRPDADARGSEESERVPVDRSFDMDRGHLLPPPDDPDRRTMVFKPSAPRGIEWSADRLVNGGIIAFPTDTVYAVAASLAHPEAVARLAALKTRSAGKPIPILLASAAALELVAREPDERLELLAARYWPGPLTVAVPARDGLPKEVVAPDGTIGARVPNHFLALEILERVGGAAAGTSANRAGGHPARTGEDVLAAFDGEIDLLLDGGLTPGGVSSTVVRLAGDRLEIIREGPIASEHLMAAWQSILAGEHDTLPTVPPAAH